MPDPPQGIWQYAGITLPISGNFTLTHGATPSSATIYCAPQDTIIWKVGPMVITYGSVELTFLDCTADKITVQFDGSGKQVWAVHILDRRWKWKECGRISGYYNVRRGDDKVLDGTEQTPKELATLCFEALDEENFDIDDMPDDPRPEIEWDYMLPGEALARLCDDLACRVVLQLDNTIKVVKVTEGIELEVNELAIDGSVEPDPPERPDSLVFTAAHTRFQMDLELEAVGLDFNEEAPVDPDTGEVTEFVIVKPIDDLSYIPDVAGAPFWGKVDLPNFKAVRLDARELAKTSVFKWYRIKVPFTLKGFSVEVDDDDEPIDVVVEDLDRILPIENMQIEKHWVDASSTRREPLPAWIHGDFLPGLDSTADAEADKPIKNKLDGAKFHGSFSVDTATGIVKFSEAMYRHYSFAGNVQNADGNYIQVNEIEPADIKLRTTFSLRDEDTRGWFRYEKKRELPPPLSDTLPRYIVREDVTLEYVYVNDEPEINEEDVEEQADYYMDEAVRGYQFTAPMSVTYAGFLPLNPDGAIQQVTWVTDQAGFARTRANRNKEELVYAPSHKERRMIERMREELKKERQTERQTDKKQKKGQP